MPTKVFAYGCKPPRDGIDLIAEQISLGHKYYNRLIELHRKQIEDAEQARRDLFPAFAATEQAVADADAKVEAIVEAIRKANAAARRKRATPEESQRLADAKAERKAAWTARKEMRAAIASDAGLQTRLAEIYAAFKDAGHKARAECGVYWGTYLKVEAAVEAAVKKTIGPPHFRRWDGAGQVAVQIQLGASWQDVILGRGKVKGLLRAEPLPCNRTSPKSARPWMFSIRIGSDESNKPIWAKVMAYMQPTYPIPEDGKIMGVSLVRSPLPPHRMSDGSWRPRYDWSLQFTVRTNQVKPRATSGKCGIDLGWRLIDGNLRVAYLVGDDGYREELTLPVSLLDRWSKSESIQGIRDRAFDEACANLIGWKIKQEALPEWFAEAAQHVGLWKAKGKLSRLIDQWRDNRIEGDGDIFASLEEWRAQDIHLWQYEHENRTKAQRIRLHIYRNFARRVATRYKDIVVEDCDWRKLARKPKADDNTNQAGATTYMRIASVSKIRELLKQDGARMVDAANTTRKCHACGSVEEFDQAKELVHTCSQCALPWDQDYNASMNLLASGGGTGETPGTARESESNAITSDMATEKKYVGRWERRKAERSKKEAESGAV